MDPVTGWTGRTACALQAALRLSNETFAEWLGIGVRTVAAWHQKPTLRPRPEMQQVLDTALEQAPQTHLAAVYLPQLFTRMGIADEIDRKAKPQQSGAAVAECVASGEADVGITLIPEILPIKGARVIGKLPAALADDTTYTAAVSAGSSAPAAASAFIAALARPVTREVWQAAGFERAG